MAAAQADIAALTAADAIVFIGNTDDPAARATAEALNIPVA